MVLFHNFSKKIVESIDFQDVEYGVYFSLIQKKLESTYVQID